jgi:DNA primase small subunit
MQLLQELDKAGEGANWEHTSLKPYVDMLDRHVVGILDDVRRRERARAVLQHDLNW